MLGPMIRWSNPSLFRLLLKMVSDRVGVKLALRFRTSGAGFATLLPMGEKCAGEEVLAGFGRHHRRSAEDGQMIVRNGCKST
jgi:hypothetical protein